MNRHDDSADNERIHDRLRTVLAVGLVAALLAPTVAPAAQAAYAELETRQMIEVVYVADDEPRYVAEQIAAFADDADLVYQTRAVDSPGELKSAIAGSDAAMLVVAGHGATRQAGPGSGIEVGDQVVHRAAIVDAIHDSGADRFFFAVCGLGMPDAVDGRSVEGYDGDVDMKIATIGALSDIGYLYSRSTAEELVPTFRTAVDRIASEEEIVARMIQPQDPLHDHGNGDDPSCHDSWHNGSKCDWSSEAEDNGTSRQRSESGAWPELGGFLNMGDTMQLEWDNGDWAFLVEVVAPDCLEVYEVNGLNVPGYDLQDQLDRLPGVKTEADAFELEVCGSVSLGIPADANGDGEGQVNGEIVVKGGSELELKIQFGWAHIEIEAWIGLTAPIEMSLTVDDNETDDHDNSLDWRLEFETSLNFVAQAEWGYVDASVYVRLGSFETCWGTSCDGSQEESSRGPPIGGAPYVSGTEPKLQEATQTLTRANLQHLDDNPAFADRLSEAIDRDATDLAVGTRLNLRNADVCEAIYGDDPLCEYAEPSVEPVLGNGDGGPGPVAPASSGSGSGSDDDNQCSGDNGECGEASSTEQRTYRQACAQIRNATNDTPVGKQSCPVKSLPVNSYKDCMDWTEAESVCDRLAMAPSAQDIVKKRSIHAVIGAMVPNISEMPDRGLHQHDTAVVLRSACERVFHGVEDPDGMRLDVCQVATNLTIPIDPENDDPDRYVPEGVNLWSPVESVDRRNERIRAAMAVRETGSDVDGWTKCFVGAHGCSQGDGG